MSGPGRRVRLRAGLGPGLGIDQSGDGAAQRGRGGDNKREGRQGLGGCCLGMRQRGSGNHFHVGSSPFPKRLPVTSRLSGSGRQARPRAPGSGPCGVAVTGSGGHTRVGWQPLRVGTLAGSVLPFISLGPMWNRAMTAVVTAYFGVSHSGRARSCLQ